MRQLGNMTMRQLDNEYKKQTNTNDYLLFTNHYLLITNITHNQYNMPKTQHHILLLLFSLLLASCKQKTITQYDSQNDSVRKYMGLGDDFSLSSDERIKHNNKAFYYINLRKNDSFTCKFLYSNAVNDYFYGNQEKLFQKAGLLKDLADSSGDKTFKACSLRLYGLYYLLKSENEIAISFLLKAQKLAKPINQNLYFTIRHDVALVQYYANDYLGSIYNSLRTIQEIKKSNLSNEIKKEVVIRANFNIGCNTMDLGESKQARVFFLKAKSSQVEDYPYSEGDYGIVIGLTYLYSNEYDNAKSTFLRIITEENKRTDPNSYCKALSYKSLLELGTKKFIEIEKDLLLVEKSLVLTNDVYFRNQNFNHLSICYAKAKDTINAIKAAKKAVALSKEYKNPSDILECLNQLIQVDRKNASKYGHEYIRINDSMQIAERRFRDKFARIAFETDEITLQKDKAVQRTWWLAGAFSVAVFIGLLLFLVYYQRNKQKKLRHQQQQEQANQEIYQLMLSQQTKEEEARQSEKKRIAQELHDGVMNKLASTRLNLSVLRNEKNPALIEKDQPFIEGIYNIEQEIRAIAHGLNNQMFLESNSFTRVLQDFVEQQNQLQQAQYTLEIDSNIDWNTISEAIKMNLYRIIQEASANANKFAQAQHVTISFVKDQNNLCFSIFDDGKGFDPELTHNDIGIKNMKERVAKLNGKLLIHSTVGKNTMISGVVPIG